jgi:hypothetical protein
MNQITFAPVSVNVSGTTSTERSLSVVRHASEAAKLMLSGSKGKVGVEARSGMVLAGAAKVASACSHGNYLPLAEYVCATLGEPLMISSRSTYEALPDIFEAKIASAKMGKNGGFRVDNKTGLTVPGAKLSKLLTLKAEITAIMGGATALRDQRNTAGASVQVGGTVEA